MTGPERMWLLHIYKKQGQKLPSSLLTNPS